MRVPLLSSYLPSSSSSSLVLPTRRLPEARGPPRSIRESERGGGKAGWGETGNSSSSEQAGWGQNKRQQLQEKELEFSVIPVYKEPLSVSRRGVRRASGWWGVGPPLSLFLCTSLAAGVFFKTTGLTPSPSHRAPPLPPRALPPAAPCFTPRASGFSPSPILLSVS